MTAWVTCSPSEVYHLRGCFQMLSSPSVMITSALADSSHSILFASKDGSRPIADTSCCQPAPAVLVSSVRLGFVITGAHRSCGRIIPSSLRLSRQSSSSSSYLFACDSARLLVSPGSADKLNNSKSFSSKGGSRFEIFQSPCRRYARPP